MKNLRGMTPRYSGLGGLFPVVLALGVAPLAGCAGHDAPPAQLQSLKDGPGAAPTSARPTKTPRVAGFIATEPAKPLIAPPPRVAMPSTSAGTPAADTTAPGSGITTGSLKDPTPAARPPLDDAEVLEVAARTQAALDIVKLELAARTYDEAKKPGESVFKERPDWKLLEAAGDAMSAEERAAADATGFTAHTYVNDTTKTLIVAIAGTQDVRRDLLTADVWSALIRSSAPQQFFYAKGYVRSVINRYQLKGYSTECVGHSLGGGACAYAASELGIRAIVVNPISAGRLPPTARDFVTNYIVDGDIAEIVYSARGNEIAGDIRRIGTGRDQIKMALRAKFGLLAGPILVIKSAADSVNEHRIARALERIAAHANVPRPK